MLNQVHGVIASELVPVMEGSIPALRFTLACRRDYTVKTSIADVDYIECVAYCDTAVYLNLRFAKGDHITVSGRLRTDRVTDAEGDPHTTAEIVVDRGEGYAKGVG